MAGERYKHIFLPGPDRIEGYTNPRKGRTQFQIPELDRKEHGNLLINRMRDTWKEAAKQQKAVSLVKRHGIYIDFIVEAGADFIIKSLENLRSGIRLCNIRKNKEQEEKIFATVYVPLNKRGYFLNKIEDYLEKETKKDNPKNYRLINCISDVSLAILESFWQDKKNLMPNENPQWIEIWLTTDLEQHIKQFESLLDQLEIKKDEGIIKFPERSVLIVKANRHQMEQIILNSDDIAEFRLAKEVATVYIEMENKDQVEVAKDLLNRTEILEETDVTVCILDSGVNNGHMLLKQILNDEDLDTVKAQWGTDDNEGHGTLMAGMAAYGNLLDYLTSNNTIKIPHRLESVKILPPPPEKNPKKLWGYYTAQGIFRVEINKPNRKRINCLAVSSAETRERGRPTSWSGALDKITSGDEDDRKRLLIASAGNINDQNCGLRYFDDNLTNEVHDPGQAWNILTVGAFTEIVNIQSSSLEGYNPVAPPGGLSPFSTTSLTWPKRKWPVKPEVLFEGGNIAKGPNDSINTEELGLLSTYHKPTIAQFGEFNATSAAAAQASHMAAHIQAMYPDAWPETIRALLVHTAEWTETMKQQFLENENKTSYAKLLRICGYGVPNLEKALYCAANSLTLISQAEMQPYDKKDSRYVTRDMHLYDLPWPSEVLLDMCEIPVLMRITLSYFIEPGPGEIGWKDRYRYPSHILRFDVNGAGESENEFIKRINKQARDEEEEHPGTDGPGDHWVIGTARNVGSIHSDIWKGTAADLSRSNLLAIYPAIGWWNKRAYLGRWNKRCRYSLIVSIYSPEEEIDIYTPVAVKVGIETPIEINIS